MIKIDIPLELQSMMNDPEAKKVFHPDPQPMYPNSCENCGGMGVLTAFVAYNGPFDSPTSPNTMRNDKHLSNKSEIIDGRVKWWTGHTFSAPCPVCQDKPYVPRETRQNDIDYASIARKLNYETEDE